MQASQIKSNLIAADVWHRCYFLILFSYFLPKASSRTKVFFDVLRNGLSFYEPFWMSSGMVIVLRTILGFWSMWFSHLVHMPLASASKHCLRQRDVLRNLLFSRSLNSCCRSYVRRSLSNLHSGASSSPLSPKITDILGTPLEWQDNCLKTLSATGKCPPEFSL